MDVKTKEKFFIKLLWHKLNLAVLDDQIEIEDCGTVVKIKADVLDISNKFFDSKEMFDKWVEKNKDNSTCLSIKINLLDLIVLTNEGYN
jgi:hypothetical protein